MKHRNHSNNKHILFSLILGITLVSMAAFKTPAQVDGGISIGPPKMEIVIPAGGEKTVGMAVDYTRDFPTARLPLARLVARLEDWTIKGNGEISFAPINTMPRSAAAWTTYSPSEFTLAADSRQIIRFTISVPKETAPGDYYLACYVEGREAPPPPKEGERQINVSFRYYTIIYVMVPGLTTDGALKGLEAKVVDGIPVVMPEMENNGNSRLRPKHSVEIRDSGDKVVYATQMAEALVVLGGKGYKMSIPVDAELPAGKYKLAYTVDFGDKKALQIGKTAFAITDTDVATRLAKTKPKSTVATAPPKAASDKPDAAATAANGANLDRPAAKSGDNSVVKPPEQSLAPTVKKP